MMKLFVAARFVVVLAALLSAFGASIAPAAAQSAFEGDGFAGLGANASEFATPTPGRAFFWPDDHGPHAGYRIEWWYVTANLADADGRVFGVQWTLFRQQLAPDVGAAGWARNESWMAHAAVTSETAHRSGERFARGGVGQAGAIAAPFSAWLDDWSLEAIDPTVGFGIGDLRMTADGAEFSIDLRLRTDAAPVLQGDAGYSVKSDRGQASYYYSQPYYEASGVVEVAGRRAEVTGVAWMDREWSSQPLAPDQTGWDWFSLHLDSGDKLMMFRLRDASGGAFFAGAWIGVGGRVRALDRSEIEIEPLEARDDGPARRWRLGVPSEGVDLRVEAVFDDAWTGETIVYWEGPLRVSGTHGGVGYLESTGAEIGG